MVTTRPVCAPCVRICTALPRRRQPIILILCPAPRAIALRELFYILGRLCHAAVALRFRDLIDLLEGGPEFLDSFDAELFGELVEKIIIESNDSVRFCLKNGLELRESIERTVR